MRALTLAAFLFVFTGAVYADNEIYQLDDMTVTAEKREGNAQKTAIPMSVINETDIEDYNINKISDLSLYIPNLMFLSSGRLDGGSFNYRGLGMFGMSVLTERSPVVVNIDGIPQESRFGLSADFGNVERVEFLRGPQGTLYGKNAMAGVLNIITKDTSNEFSGKVTAHAEEHDTFGAGFRINTPAVEDKLFFNMSGSYEKTKGWMKDHTPGGEKDWNNLETKNISLKTVYRQDTTFKASLQYSYSDSDAGNAPYISGTRNITYDITTDFKNPEFKAHTHNTAFKADYAAPVFDVTSITTFRSTHSESQQYFGQPVYGGFDNIDEDVFTQEFRFSSHDNSNGFKWLAGLFASTEDMKRKNTGYTFDMSYYGYGVVTYDYPVSIESEIYSAFSEVSIPLFVPELTLTLGSRYEYVKRDMDHGYIVTYHDLSNTTSENYDIDGSWNAVLGKAALEYKYSKNLLLYFSASQGYMPGGFNYTETNKEFAAFDEQKSIDYEIGFKSTAMDGKLMFNTNLFYSKYKDLQISEEAAPMKFVVSNAGKAHAQGVEADFAARLTREIHMFGSLGIIEAKYDDYKENMGSGLENYNGNHMTNTPAYTADLGIKYRNKAGIFAMTDIHRFGKTYFSKNNSDHFKRDEITLVNAKIGWETESGFEAYVYARNLFDKEYFTETVEEYNLFLAAEPRTIGVQVGYRF